MKWAKRVHLYVVWLGCVRVRVHVHASNVCLSVGEQRVVRSAVGEGEGSMARACGREGSRAGDLIFTDRDTRKQPQTGGWSKPGARDVDPAIA